MQFALSTTDVARWLDIYNRANALRIATYSPGQKAICLWTGPASFDSIEARTRRHARRAIRQSGVRQSMRIGWLRLA